MKRAKRYTEPTACLFPGGKKNHIEAFYPLLDWTSDDIVEFVNERGIKLHPLYYNENGVLDVSRRLGCMCCPLAYYKKRLVEFKQHPAMVKAYIRAGKKFIETHPNTKTAKTYGNAYEFFYRNVFCDSQADYEKAKFGLFPITDFKKYIEDYFNIKLE